MIPEPPAPPPDDDQILKRARSQGPRVYPIEGEVGRGAMGEVLLVRDPVLNRRLAMKMIPAALLEAHPELLDRFIREASITASLDHPGIVPVHELAVDDTGRPFFTMKLVEGETLEGVLRRARGGARIIPARVPGSGPGNRVLFVDNPTAGFEDHAQRMRIADDPDFHFTNTMTIALWMYALPSATKHSARMADQSWQHSWSLEVHGGEKRVTTEGIPGRPRTEPKAYALKRWHHVAMVYDFDPDAGAGTARVYVDGVEKAGAKVSSPINTCTREILLGGTKDNKYATAYAFHGYLDDVRFYDTALTRSEIAALRESRPRETVFVIEP